MGTVRQVAAAVALVVSPIGAVAASSPPPDEPSVAPVTFREPPPAIRPAPFASIDLGVADAVAITNDGGVVAVDTDGLVATRLGSDGRVRGRVEIAAVGHSPIVGPSGDVLYSIEWTPPVDTSVSQMPTVHVIAVALAGERAGQVVASAEIDYRFIEPPRFPVGQGMRGIIDRSTKAGDLLMPYVDTMGVETGEMLPVAFLTIDEQDVVHAISEDREADRPAATEWALQIERAPNNPTPFAGQEPPVPTMEGGGAWFTEIGPPARPGDYPPATLPVIADLRPDGGVRWWSVPDGWHVAAMDVGGTLLARPDNGTLDLARLRDTTYEHQRAGGSRFTPPLSTPAEALKCKPGLAELRVLIVLAPKLCNILRIFGLETCPRADLRDARRRTTSGAEPMRGRPLRTRRGLSACVRRSPAPRHLQAN